jgi:BirA family biotin operon repressor/biotin-[acetyl-CoA-carboxylase] ligase
LLPSYPKSIIGQPFIEFDSITSTNMYAMEQLQAGLAQHGTAYFAHFQSEGRGQRGKQWSAEPGLNIALSVVLDTRFLSPLKPFPLSRMVANACHHFFSRYAGDETVIKWPNDLYWRDRKAGGILIENLIRGNEWTGAVVGMGININQTSFPAHLPNPVSLQQITGKKWNTVSLAKELCTCLQSGYQQLATGNDVAEQEYYNRHLYCRGKKLRLKKDNAAFYATVQSVSDEGELKVSGAAQETYRFGEVEWIWEAGQHL